MEFTRPQLLLRLTPQLNGDGEAASIEAYMEFDAPSKRKGEAMFHHLLQRGPTKTQQYDADAINLRSPKEPIGLEACDRAGSRWRDFTCDRSLEAQRLVAEYKAVPAKVGPATPCGPQIALETDGGGLSAGGMSFILTIATAELEYHISLEWDLSDAPLGTRSVCTWGEGTSLAFDGIASAFEEAFLIVGPIHSFPSETSDCDYGAYWLSEPPFDASQLAKDVGIVVPKMRSFFRDDDPLFRIFIRQNEYKCNSGRGLYRGFVFAWNNIQPRATDLTEFVFHEIVHNWPRLGFSIGGPTKEELADGWFNEGIAEYYSLILPYRFGVFTEDDFVRRFNNRLSAYYTNPDRHVPNHEVPDKFWRPGHVDRIPYQRGFMYFVSLCYQLRQAGKQSLDDLILNMVELRNASKPHGIKLWLSLVEANLGSEAYEDYRNMSNAELIRLPIDCLQMYIRSSQRKLQQTDQEEFYLGFPEGCLKAGTVKELNTESRAAHAGVQEGDNITSKYSYIWDLSAWESMFSMVVIRDGKEVSLSWWPRSFKTVESYQFSKV